MTCPECATKDREIARLRRELESAAHAVDHFERKWVELAEQKKGKS